jgi:hypothetical protein
VARARAAATSHPLVRARACAYRGGHTCKRGADARARFGTSARGRSKRISAFRGQRRSDIRHRTGAALRALVPPQRAAAQRPLTQRLGALFRLLPSPLAPVPASHVLKDRCV